MQCPLCVDESLEAHMRSGVEIDVCPRCRGVWLDRGEIDKLAGSAIPSSAGRAPTKSDRDDDDDDDDRYKDRKKDKRSRDDRDRDQRRKRKKSFGERLADVLEEIID